MPAASRTGENKAAGVLCATTEQAHSCNVLCHSVSPCLTMLPGRASGGARRSHARGELVSYTMNVKGRQQMMPPSDQAALERIRQAAEQLQRLAGQQPYEDLAAPNLLLPGSDYRGLVRIPRATGAVAVLEQHDDGGFAWRPLPMAASAS